MNNLPFQHPGEHVLVDVLNVRQRKIAYKAHQLVGLLLMVVGVVLSGIEQGVPPQWFVITVAVYAAVSPFFTKLADDNAVPVSKEIDWPVHGLPGDAEPLPARELDEPTEVNEDDRYSDGR